MQINPIRIPHAYDIDLIKALRQYEVFVKHHTKDEEMRKALIAMPRIFLGSYCGMNKINFQECYNKNTQVIYVHNGIDGNLYEKAITYALLTYDILEIPHFLDYHKSQYKGRNNFVDLIKTPVYRDVRLLTKICPKTSTTRGVIIMGWVNNHISQQNALPETKAISTPVKKAEIKSGAYLDWIVDKKRLVNLSNELWAKGYTKYAKDFEKVFTKRDKCVWMKDNGSLSYILKQVHKKGYFAVRGRKSDAIFGVAEMYFCDNSGNVAKKINLRSALYNFSNKPSATQVNAKKDIDFILSNIK